MNKLFGCLLFIFAFLMSCTQKPQSQTYFDAKQQVLPDSAKVKALLSVSQGSIKEKLSAVMFIVPNEKYRLELSGTFGLSAASILWKKDGWKIVLPQDERYMEGEGDCIFIPVYGGVNIHELSLLFLGQRVETIDCKNSLSNLKLEYNDNSVSVLWNSEYTDNSRLGLEIKNIDAKAKWSDGVWNLSIPDNYIRTMGY